MSDLEAVKAEMLRDELATVERRLGATLTELSQVQAKYENAEHWSIKNSKETRREKKRAEAAEETLAGLREEAQTVIGSLGQIVADIDKGKVDERTRSLAQSCAQGLLIALKGNHGS